MNHPQPVAAFFPEAETTASGYLPVSPLHTIYWEEAGTPAGIPVLVLHGGPGAGASPLYRRFFDPARWRIISFDQRGCGRSAPTHETRENTTAHLVADIELLRRRLSVKKWLVCGGSWGATLGLAYAQAHPEHVLGLLLRSIFLGTADEIRWFFEGGRLYHPEAWLRFLAPIPAEERADLLAAYHARLFCGDPATELAAARAWCSFEATRSTMLPADYAGPDHLSLQMAKLEAHYFRHQCFLQPDQLVLGMPRLRQLPVILVHGRYDMLCPPSNAFRLIQGNPNVQLQLVPTAGHHGFEPPIANELINQVQFLLRSGNLSM